MSLLNPLSESDWPGAKPGAIAWAGQVYRACLSMYDSGPTGSRPAQFLWVGRRYFDTTLGMPIWWTGPAVTDWVDATGASA